MTQVITKKKHLQRIVKNKKSKSWLLDIEIDFYLRDVDAYFITLVISNIENRTVFKQQILSFDTD